MDEYKKLLEIIQRGNELWADWNREMAFAQRVGGMDVLRWLARRTDDFAEMCNE